MKKVVRIVILSVFAFCLSIACKNYTEDIEDYLSYWSAGVSIAEYRFEPQPQIYTEGMQYVSSKAPVTVTFTVHNSKNLNLKMPGDADAPADIMSFPHIPDAPDKRVAAPQSGNDYEFKKISNTELKLTYNPAFLQKYEWGRGDITPSIILYTTDGRVFKQNIPFKLNVNTPPPAIAECVIGQTETAPPSETCYYQKYTDGCEENISDEIPFDVPEGWVWCRLGEICTFKGGGTPDTSNPSYWNGSLNWASVKDIKGDFLYSTTDKITELGLKNSSGYLAKIDDIILITRIVPGKAIITKIETAINQDLKIILPKIEIEKQVLLYFFRQNEDDFVGKSSGTTVKGIKLEYITSKFIPIPPLAEQKRIVAKIEELFAKLDFITTTLTE